MSYWTYMQIDTGGPEHAVVEEIGNMTGNVSGMWAKALGCRLHELEGKTGAELAPRFREAVDNIENPDTRHEYEAMNPPNGWGSVASAQVYLVAILKACERHPKAYLSVSR